MDLETSEFYQRVRESYLGIAKNEPKRFQIVDADRSIEKIQSDIVEIVENFLEK